MTRAPRPLTPERIRRIALHHLDRYESSAAGLRRVLMRRVDRVVRAGLGEAGALAVEVEKVVAACVSADLVDDARYAEAAARRLRARGASSRRIRAWLDAKGVDRGVADAALAEEEVEDPDLAAALALARRRRIGPWRTGAADPELRRKELGILARAGFPYEVARRALDAERPEGP